MAKVELKQPVIDEISANIKDAQSVVVVDYRGLTVAEDTQLRKELREAGVTYKVYKNTMMNFAFKGTDYESLAPVLEGPSAIAISTEDATAPARILAKFAKTAPALEIKAGVVEGTFYDANGMQAVAAVPSRDELEACSHLSQIWLEFLTRSLSRAAKHRQQKSNHFIKKKILNQI